MFGQKILPFDTLHVRRQFSVCSCEAADLLTLNQ